MEAIFRLLQVAAQRCFFIHQCRDAVSTHPVTQFCEEQRSRILLM